MAMEDVILMAPVSVSLAMIYLWVAVFVLLTTMDLIALNVCLSLFIVTLFLRYYSHSC